MINVLVTGGTGFIGSRLVKELIKRGDSPIVLKRVGSDLGYLEDVIDSIELIDDPKDIGLLSEILINRKIDVVVHLAAFIKGEHLPGDVSNMLESNIYFGTRILEAMKIANVKKFINTGSFWQESKGSNSYHPVNLYSATKESFEKILQYYVDVEGFLGITLKLYEVYGPGDKRKKLINQIIDSSVLNLTQGEQLVDYVHVDDVVSGYITAFDSFKQEYKVYYLSTTRFLPLREVIKEFSNVLNPPIKLNFGAIDYRKGQTMKPFLGELLPDWKSQISLKEGIKSLLRKVN